MAHITEAEANTAADAYWTDDYNVKWGHFGTDFLVATDEAVRRAAAKGLYEIELEFDKCLYPGSPPTEMTHILNECTTALYGYGFTVTTRSIHIPPDVYTRRYVKLVWTT